MERRPPLQIDFLNQEGDWGYGAKDRRELDCKNLATSRGD